jgi:hypothetical protein
MFAVLCEIPSDFFFFIKILIFLGFGGNVVVALSVIFCSLILITLDYSVTDLSLFRLELTEDTWLEEKRERSAFENCGVYLNKASSFSSLTGSNYFFLIE